MPETMVRLYAELVVNFKVLATNFTDCPTVLKLQILAAGVVVLLGARMAAHSVIARRLRRSAPCYDEGEQPRLYELYRRAGREVGLGKLPPLRRSSNRRPHSGADVGGSSRTADIACRASRTCNVVTVSDRGRNVVCSTASRTG